MQINVTTDYGIRAVLYLAIQNKVTASSDVASAMGIPKSYILKITNKLLAAGIVKRVVGAKGGFLLARKIEEINLYEILKAMEPTMNINRCLEEDEYCSRFATESCPVRKFYCRLQSSLEIMLKTMTVKEILE
ncbi:RrF2 family transcriptional regulator [Phascolarctobacterium faecium]|uniref:RrF2 family transcriptional regulator n=1 Tax=Phascolarctobacterium faecium TaxID=33025 RepID=UPI003A959CAC